ncbi:hypothetical protein FBEOM_12447 [Fusarium beomiforme]|uniref:Ankyrin n=1 Tax=Fusarium beomiforme TaxID=44412 RepID=A0A9P5A7Q7_9HYPO|nr:hypothetical protein FBEOM_12447 [Fusarium beomiforme]
MNGHVEIVDLPLNEGVDPDPCRDDESLLLSAVKNGHDAVVKLLLERGSSTDVTTRRPIIPGSIDIATASFHLAATRKGSKPMMEMLLKAGADIHDRDTKGNTCLLIAASQASAGEVEFLIANGADVNAQNDTEETCIYKAMGSKVFGYEITKTLLENGARIDARNRHGETCLHFLGHQRGFITLADVWLELLAIYGADLNIRDNNGNTPLHHIAGRGEFETLMSYTNVPGVDINARDCKGWTPLHAAAASIWFDGDKKAAILVEKGADVNYRNNEGRTPLDEAYIINNREVARYREKNGGAQR